MVPTLANLICAKFTITRAYSRNLGQRSILARKGTFLCKKGISLKKGPPKIHPSPYSIPFLSVLHQNKVLHNFRKREQRSIVERNIGLGYALITETNFK